MLSFNTENDMNNNKPISISPSKLFLSFDLIKTDYKSREY